MSAGGLQRARGYLFIGTGKVLMGGASDRQLAPFDWAMFTIIITLFLGRKAVTYFGLSHSRRLLGTTYRYVLGKYGHLSI